jgi:predicted MFS family arabinose efflux permease
VKEISILPFSLLRRNARIYIPYLLRSLGAQAIWSIFPLYLVWVGADMLLVGVLYFINLFSQFIIMRQIERFKNLYLVNIGLLCTVLTFIGYALSPQLPALFLLQLLLALSFSTLQVGSMQELLAKNVEQSTALSVLNGISNLTAVVGPFMAGYIILGFGYPGLMWVGAALAFVGLVSFTTVLE